MNISQLKQKLENKDLAPHLVLVGDVHGYYDSYKEIIKNANYSLQVGDMAGRFNANISGYLPLNEVDPNRHKFIGGNHENYASRKTSNTEIEYTHTYIRNNELYEFFNLPPHYLGDYGIWQIPDVIPGELSGNIFFLRGAWSIDCPFNPFGIESRKLGVDFFEEEELTTRQFNDAFDLYQRTKPDFVVTHACPLSVQKNLHLYKDGDIQLGRTAQSLDMFLEAHKPKIWVFGHYHQSKIFSKDGVVFACLDTVRYFSQDGLFNGCCLAFDKNLNILI